MGSFNISYDCFKTGTRGLWGLSWNSDAKSDFKHIFSDMRKFYASGTYSLFSRQISDRFTVLWLICGVFLMHSSFTLANRLAPTNHFLHVLGKVSDPERRLIKFCCQADKAPNLFAAVTLAKYRWLILMRTSDVNMSFRLLLPSKYHFGCDISPAMKF